METVELVVYLVVAIIIGGMILLLTQETAQAGLYETIKGLMSPDDELGFDVLDNTTLAPFLFQVWDECGLGARELNVTFQYVGNPLTQEGLFVSIKQLRLCNSFSSAEFDCGTREDLNLTALDQTVEEGILVARCDPELEQLFVE